MSIDPYGKLLWCFFIAELVGAIVIISDSVRQDLGHSAAILQYAPTTIFPVVVFGALISLTKSKKQIALTFTAMASYIMFFLSGVFTQGGITTFIVVVLLLFFRAIRLPGILKKPMMMIAEASLFIYLTHMPFQFAAQKVLGDNIDPMSLVVVSIVVSMGLWVLWKNIVIKQIRNILAQCMK